MNLFFRPANQTDFELTYRLKSRSLKPYVKEIWGWDEDTQRQYHLKNFNSSLIKIIGNGEEEFGLLEIIENEKEIFIAKILIEEDYQGKGIGARIMEQLDHKGKKLQLEVFKINHRAVKFYKKHGFNITDETELKWVMEKIPESP